MGLVIALAGKGGTGKTTLSALMVRALVEDGVRPVLAVDADPNSNLAEALGVEPGRPLAEIREQGSSPEGSPASGVGRARVVEDELHRAISEAEGFDLITMGRPEGPRCYCYVNTLLRKSLDELCRNYEAVVIDNEAGLEHLSRRTTTDVDWLVAVMNPTRPSYRAVERIFELARSLPVRIGRLALVVNRTTGPLETKLAEDLERLQVVRLPDVPQDDSVEQAGAEERPVFALDQNSPAFTAVKELVKLLRNPAGATAG